MSFTPTRARILLAPCGVEATRNNRKNRNNNARLPQAGD